MADDVVYINVEEGLKRVVKNTGLYVKLLNKFKDDTNLAEIENAIAAGDTEKAKDAVHTLKGIAANLSFTELYGQCIEIESQIKAGSLNPDQITIFKNVHDQTLTEIDKVIARYG